MYEFDVKYTFDNYLEYYKFVLIKQRLIRDLLFAILFIGFGVYFFIKIFFLTEEGETPQPLALPILAVSMGVILPLMNLLTLPMLKKQLKAKQDQIDSTHLSVTFKEDEVLYINLNVSEEVSKEEKTEDNNNENEELVENKEEVKEENANNENKEKQNDREFHLQYNNFMQIKETKNLFLYYLDRQTVVIIPKQTSMFGQDFASYREFILSKVNKKRVKFLKEKN